jgi:hypothetical protein
VVVVDVAWDGAAEAASAGGEERGAKGAVLIGGSGGKPSSAKEAIAVDQIGGEIRDASGWNWNGIEFLFLGGCKKWVKKKDRERERERLGAVAGSVK